MTSPVRLPWYRILYVQVVVAVFLGIILGHYYPGLGKELKPLGDGFIKLIKMIISPIIFCSVVHGIASMADLKKLGRAGAKTLFYFEIVSTIALIVGLVIVNTLRPGDGFNVDPHALDPGIAKNYIQQAHSLKAIDFVLGIIPSTFASAFTGGDLLQVLFVSVLTAFAISAMKERGKPLLHAVDQMAVVFFGILRLVVKVAPIGAFGAMAFTIGSFGLQSLQRLLALMGCFYLAAVIFIVFVLGSIAWQCGFSIFRFLFYIKAELLLVLGTSSSETALPGLMTKLRKLGCSPATVGLVVPAGYSFNLDGTNIYMTIAIVFLAQATNTPLSLEAQAGILWVAILTSKGASGVTGAGFITLAATLAIVPSIPIESIALLVGIDRFMSECRALTNLIGNGVATIAISRWEHELTPEALRASLAKSHELEHGAPLTAAP